MGDFLGILFFLAVVAVTPLLFAKIFNVKVKSKYGKGAVSPQDFDDAVDYVKEKITNKKSPEKPNLALQRHIYEQKAFGEEASRLSLLIEYELLKKKTNLTPSEECKLKTMESKFS